jgi:hypothetical protein
MNIEAYELLQKTYRFLVENPDRWIKGMAIDNNENVCAVGALRLCAGDEVITRRTPGDRRAWIVEGYEVTHFAGISISRDVWESLNIEAAKRGYGYITKANDSGGYEVVLSIFETVLSENAPKTEKAKELIEV